MKSAIALIVFSAIFIGSIGTTQVVEPKKLPFPPVIINQPAKNKFTSSTTKKWVNRKDGKYDTKKGGLGGHFVHFTHRDKMAKKIGREAKLPKGIPATTLPVDCTGGQTVNWPMLDNDIYGDCGWAMIGHIDQVFTFGQGKTGWGQSTFSDPAFINQYLQFSGGDNGSDEPMLVGQGGAWITSPGIAGESGAWPATAPNAQPIVYDALDIDPSNVPLMQYCIDQYYAVTLAWSVPDAFLDNFTPGATYDVPATPDPNNGHYVPLTDISAKGNYTLVTWGAYCFVTSAYVNAVQPSVFVAFSTRQFNPATGYDSHGRHITTQAAAWVAIGGNPIPATVISAFPAVSPTPPTPPTPPATTGTITVAITGQPPVVYQIGGTSAIPPGMELQPAGTGAWLLQIKTLINNQPQSTKPEPIGPPINPPMKKAASLTFIGDNGPDEANAPLVYNDIVFRTWLKNHAIGVYGAAKTQLTNDQKPYLPPQLPGIILQDTSNMVLLSMPLDSGLDGITKKLAKYIDP